MSKFSNKLRKKVNPSSTSSFLGGLITALNSALRILSGLRDATCWSLNICWVSSIINSSSWAEIRLNGFTRKTKTSSRNLIPWRVTNFFNITYLIFKVIFFNSIHIAGYPKAVFTQRNAMQMLFVHDFHKPGIAGFVLLYFQNN